MKITTFLEDGIEYSTFFDDDGNEWVPLGRTDFDKAKGHYVFTQRGLGHFLSEIPF
jgi:predicted lipoprotein with Yx(FWY)xxD motif